MPSMKLQLRKESLKKFRLDHDSNPWPLRYQCSVLPCLRQEYLAHKNFPLPVKKFSFLYPFLTRTHLISWYQLCSTHVSDCCYSSSASLISMCSVIPDQKGWRPQRGNMQCVRLISPDPLPPW